MVGADDSSQLAWSEDLQWLSTILRSTNELDELLQRYTISVQNQPPTLLSLASLRG